MAVASSHFDVDDEGWTATAAEVSHVASGGNPDGFLRFVDASGDATFIIAPAKFLGNWSALNGTGTIFWDHQIFVTGTVSSFLPHEVRISGPGGTATFTGGTPDGTSGWIQQSAPIEVASWTVNSGSWPAILANVTDFRISIEQVVNLSVPEDIAGIDNVVLDGPAVPLAPPWATLVLLLAILGAGYFVKRRTPLAN